MNKAAKFEIGVKAESLYFSVFDITTNRDHYPVRHRRLSDALQNCSLAIHSDLLDANSLYPEDPYRLRLQTQALSNCEKFLSLTKYSLHARLISFATSEKWTKLVRDIKYMTLAWRKA